MTGFLLEHGYLVLFTATLAAQLGVPVPGIPLLLAAGVLARSGSLSATAALGLTVVASGLGHLGWYEAGRRRGTAVLRLLCKFSIEPAELVARLGSENPPLVVDLRSELTAGGETIRGAHRVPRDDLPRWAEGIPREREIILACD